MAPGALPLFLSTFLSQGPVPISPPPGRLLSRKSLPGRPEGAILRKAHLQGVPLAGAWELGFLECSHHILPDEHGSLCPNCAKSVVYAERLLPSGSLGLWYAPGRGCLCDQPPVATLGPMFPISFPGRRHFTCIVTIQC